MVPTCATCQGYDTQMLLMHSKKGTVHASDRENIIVVVESWMNG